MEENKEDRCVPSPTSASCVVLSCSLARIVHTARSVSKGKRERSPPRRTERRICRGSKTKRREAQRERETEAETETDRQTERRRDTLAEEDKVESTLAITSEIRSSFQVFRCSFAPLAGHQEPLDYFAGATTRRSHLRTGGDSSRSEYREFRHREARVRAHREGASRPSRIKVRLSVPPTQPFRAASSTR